MTPPPIFALLDDAHASAAQPTSRLYTGFVREHRCEDPALLDAVCVAVDRDLRGLDGPALQAVVLADYEWGCRLLKAGLRSDAESAPPGALRVLMFSDCHRLDHAGVSAWLAAADGGVGIVAGVNAGISAHGNQEPSPAGVRGWHANVDDAAFTAAIHQVQDWIRAGETYQINYTYRLHGEAWGSPLALYRRLRLSQPVSYGALIALPPDGLPDAKGAQDAADAAASVDAAAAAGHAADAERAVGAQPVQGAPDPAAAQRWVLSCSPELFVRHEAGTLTTRPMKGTAARAAVPEADSATAAWLADDVKNRAENLMIVDLLRNDLGRIARTGSVRVPQLFALEPYRTVFQMTSTVKAELPPETGLATVLRALFPCGSITGAPKHHTMDLIARLEPEPRGLYTGAIGWLDAPPPARTEAASLPAQPALTGAEPVGANGGVSSTAASDPGAPAGAGSGVESGKAFSPRALGDFCWSVAIRTLQLGPEQHGPDGSWRPAVLGVGAGIVLDSIAADEYAECQLKGSFLTRLDPGFTLFETLRCEGGQLMRLDAHLARLQASAQALGFVCDCEALRMQLQQALLQPPQQQQGAVERWRVDLSADGRIQLQRSALAALAASAEVAPAPARSYPVGLVARVRLQWAPRPVPLREQVLLRHKTSLRTAYDTAVQAAMAAGAFDQLFFNARDELTEGGRSTVFVKLGGQWFTPPVHCGVLPGVMRAAVLADPRWAAQERVIRREELAAAEDWMVCNALRGCLMAEQPAQAPAGLPAEPPSQVHTHASTQAPTCSPANSLSQMPTPTHTLTLDSGHAAATLAPHPPSLDAETPHAPGPV